MTMRFPWSMWEFILTDDAEAVDFAAELYHSTFQIDLQFSPDIFEIVKPLFAYQPLCRTDGAFGEAAAGFGIVAEIDPVRSGFEDYFVESDDFSFAERCDLQSFVFGCDFADDALKCYCGA